jgi:DNA-binding MarR family transcriptional regulator
MVAVLNADRLVGVLRDTIVGTVRRDGPDLSARQFAVFLISYIEDGPHTVRGLAARLEVSKPAITRSVDRLAELGLAKRGPDPRDRRSVLILRTRKGGEFFNDVKALLNDAHKSPPGGSRAKRPAGSTSAAA